MVNYNFLQLFLSAAKIPLDLQVVHIFFDSSTFDKVERDAKVRIYQIPVHFCFCEVLVSTFSLQNVKIGLLEDFEKVMFLCVTMDKKHFHLVKKSNLIAILEVGY